jgi:hypothetical protein
VNSVDDLSAYLEQNEIVEEYTLSHICNSNTCHDYQRSEHKSFAPTFCDEGQGRGIAAPVAKALGAIGLKTGSVVALGVVKIRTGSVDVSDEENARRHSSQKNNNGD